MSLKVFSETSMFEASSHPEFHWSTHFEVSKNQLETAEIGVKLKASLHGASESTDKNVLRAKFHSTRQMDVRVCALGEGGFEFGVMVGMCWRRKC